MAAPAGLGSRAHAGVATWTPYSNVECALRPYLIHVGARNIATWPCDPEIHSREYGAIVGRRDVAVYSER